MIRGTKNTLKHPFRSVPVPASDLGLLTDPFNPSSGEFHGRSSFLHLCAAEGERSHCQMSKSLFLSETKSMRCLFFCSAFVQLLCSKTAHS